MTWVIRTTTRGDDARFDRVLDHPDCQDTVGWACTPTRFTFLTLRQGHIDTGPEPVVLERVYELRLWDEGLDVRWSAGPVPSLTVYRRTEEAHGGGDVVEIVPGRRLLWGRATTHQGGWTRLAEDRTAPLWLPVDIPLGRRAALTVHELVTARDTGLAAGNAHVTAEMIAGFAVLEDEEIAA